MKLINTLSNNTIYVIMNPNDIKSSNQISRFYYQLYIMNILVKSFNNDIRNVIYGKGIELFNLPTYTPMFSFELYNYNTYLNDIDYYCNILSLILPIQICKKNNSCVIYVNYNYDEFHSFMNTN
jgi:hypothetical protein